MSHKALFESDEEEDIALTPAPYLAHLLNLSVDWKRRIIHLSGEIAPDSGYWFWAVVEHMGEGPIGVHLTTPGGDEVSMFSIHDAIRRHGNMTVTGYGQICSAGVLILACGHRRLVTESTILMSHESTGGQEELGYQAAKDRRKADDWFHLYWAELMSRYTNNDAKWWKSKTEKTAEYWLLGGHQIVEEGLADEVV